MARRIVGWVVLVPLCVGLILFALANRQLVVVNFNPFMPSGTLTEPGYGVPLFLVIYIVLLLGVIAGGIATWFAQGRVRQEKRHWRKEAETLTRELEALRRSTGQLPARGANSLSDLDDILDKS